MNSNSSASIALDDRRDFVPAHSAWGDLKIYAGILIVLIFIYSPILSTDFLYYDDYSFFTGERGFTVTKISLSQARPVQGVMADLLNTASVEYSGAKRLVSVVGLSLLAFLLFRWLTYCRVKPLYSILIAITVCCMPSFQNIASYLTLASLSFGSFLSGLSVYVVFTARSGKEASRSGKALTALISSMLLFLALSSYQFNAMFCWVMVAIFLLTTDKDNFEKFLSRTFYFCILFGVVFLCYYLFYMKVVNMFLPSILPSGRSSLITSIPAMIDKLAWLYGDVIKYALIDILASINAVSLLYAGAIFFLVGSAIVLQDVVSKKYGAKPSIYLIKYIVLFLLVPLSFLPYMVIQEGSENVVYLSTLEALLFVYAAISFVNIFENAGLQRAKPIATMAILAVALLFTFSANKNLMLKYALPNSLDYKFVKSQILKSDMSQVERIHFVGHLNFSEVLTYSENLVKVVLLDLGLSGKEIEITSSSNKIPLIVHDHIIVRSDIYEESYVFNPSQGYYNLRDDLTNEQRAKLLDYITSIPKELSKYQGVLIIDATSLQYMY